MLKGEVPEMPSELQAVVMAAGKGSRMLDVTSTCPKPLMPVGNYPLVWYPINMLERAGFEEAIVVVLDTHYEDIKRVLCGECKVQIKLEFVVLDEDTCWGTAETLRTISDKIKTDLLVVSCDLISDVTLQQVAYIHRTHDASITMMLTPLMEPFLTAIPPGIKAGKKKDRDVIALDSSLVRVLYNQSLADFKEKGASQWQASARRLYPQMYMGSELTDCHLYFMKKWVLNYICDKSIPDAKKIISIKSDLIPQVVKSQFLEPTVKEVDDEFGDKVTVRTILDHAAPDDEAKLIDELNLHKKDHDNGIRVCTFRQTEGFAVRVNTLGTYCEANRQINAFFTSSRVNMEVDAVDSSAFLKEKTQVGPNCLVGMGTTVGAKTLIDRSIVGKHCVIGDNVKISRSVIMDYVHIGEGCDIQGSLICSQVTIEPKSDIKESVVGHHQKLQAKCRLKNEVVCAQGGMMQF